MTVDKHYPLEPWYGVDEETDPDECSHMELVESNLYRHHDRHEVEVEARCGDCGELFHEVLELTPNGLDVV